jgi:hypothetical protein
MFGNFLTIQILVGRDQANLFLGESGGSQVLDAPARFERICERRHDDIGLLSWGSHENECARKRAEAGWSDLLPAAPAL